MKMWLLIALAALFHQSEGCTFLMGDSKDSLVAHSNATHWNYGMRGDDWSGHDVTGASWICESGKKQSPVNLLGSLHKGHSHHGYSNLKTKWTYSPMTSNGSNIAVFNNGHTIQVQWDADVLSSKVMVHATGKSVADVVNLNTAYASGKHPGKPKVVQATPLQFHFHTTSEHAVNGEFFPLELHIVHVIPQSALPGCPATGCLTVTGIMFKLDDRNRPNQALDAVFKAMPMHEGVRAPLPAGTVIDLQALLPKTKSYLLYEGSLTTPPCTEGVLWHVFDQPLSISQEQYKRYARAVGLKDCKLKPAARGSRRLHDESQQHPVLAKLASFRRGAYSGFVDMAELKEVLSTPAAPGNARKLMHEGHEEVNPNDWNCTMVGYGFTNRNCQSLNGRAVVAFT